MSRRAHSWIISGKYVFWLKLILTHQGVRYVHFLQGYLAPIWNCLSVASSPQSQKVIVYVDYDINSLEYFDVVHMKSYNSPRIFWCNDYVSRRRWCKRCKPDKLGEIIRPESCDVSQDEIITRDNSLIIKWWNVMLEFPMVLKQPKLKFSVLSRKRAEYCFKSTVSEERTRWVLRQTRWVRFGTQIIGWEELPEFSPRNSVRTRKLTELGVWNRTLRNRIRPVSDQEQKFFNEFRISQRTQPH